MFNRTNARVTLMAGTAALVGIPALAQPAPTGNTTASTTSAAPETAAIADEEETIVVTGITSRNRAAITASADISIATEADIVRKAPRSTADLLELVPGIFVEGTAGAVSNNYSVRGLQGGGQRFVQLEEDGLPIIYGGGGGDFFFSQDLTIDRFEAVKGGSSGVLTVNGAGATINFLSRRPNHDRFEAIAKFGGASFGQKRADGYVSAPITDKLAFNVGGFIETSPGVRRNPFSYDGFRIKGALEYRFDDGGFIRVTGKTGDVKSAYYAGQPYALNNGKPGGVAGLDPLRDNINGSAFALISVPVSTFVEADGFRDFRLSEGVRVKTNQLRIDFEKPLNESIDLFARTRYLGLKTDFNGLFPGSGTGNAGLTSAANYLTRGPNSPIDSLLARGQNAFPTTVRFGARNLRTGIVLGSNQTAELNALNGNGFLQQTTLNHDAQSGHDFGSNVGGRWEYESGNFKNSLTAGVMYYNTRRSQNQSATATAITDVKNDADIYDIVALNANNGVIGTLGDSGLISYGNWGAGIRQSRDSAISLYANDELAIGDNIHIDGGIRWESNSAEFRDGQGAAINQPVPPGRGGVIRDVGSTFNGQYVVTKRTQSDVAWTIGANYLFTPNLSVYARYADGFQTNGINPSTGIKLYEAGLRFKYERYLTGSVTVFRTNFDNQFYQFIDPTDPTRLTDFQADLRTTGVEIDANVRPVDWFGVDFTAVFQSPTLNNLRLNGVTQTAFNGNRPERTPSTLWTVTPTISLPGGLGEVYGRYKYIGRIFADAGNGVALPGYGVTSVGVSFNVTDKVQLNLNGDNIFNVIGLTEGNPRQGQTQNAASGFFYARGIVGANYTGSVTLRF